MKTEQIEFQELVSPHMDALFGMANSLTRNRARAEDLVSEAILKAFKAFAQYERGTYFKAWVFRILKNTFISDYRRQKNYKEVSAPGGDDDFSFFDWANQQAGQDKETYRSISEIDQEEFTENFEDEVAHALESLSDDFREVIFLCDVQEFSYQEISEILELPIGTVRSRLNRARSQLQKKLADYAKEKGFFRRTS